MLTIIVGIDPGSRITGYGVVQCDKSRITFVASGVIKSSMKEDKAQRLIRIKNELDRVLKTYNPDYVAIEKIFVAKNPKSSLALGEARGVILISAAQFGVPIYEYSPKEIKRSVVGKGSAHKDQVAVMLGKLLVIDHETETRDETDALAVAFCHALRETGALGRLL
jgi:crossover junction endodeoxyribonuclease RuvC